MAGRRPDYRVYLTFPDAEIDWSDDKGALWITKTKKGNEMLSGNLTLKIDGRETKLKLLAFPNKNNSRNTQSHSNEDEMPF